MRNMYAKNLARVAAMFSLCCLAMPQMAQAQTYCTPAYTTGCSLGDRIEALTLNGDNGSVLYDPAASCASGGSYYVDKTALGVTVHANASYTLSLHTNAISGYDNAKVWVDFNNDKTFSDPGELVGSSTLIKNTTSTLQVTFPSGIVQGSYRMRVRVNVDPSLSSLTPCGSTNLGEARDYIVTFAIAPLEMHLLSFNGKASNAVNNLYWVVSGNDDNNPFIVQRSADGRSFSDLGTVANTAGNNFAFTDERPLSGTNFYRLAMKNNNGEWSYSQVINIAREYSGDLMSIYPNPAKGNVHIAYTSAENATARAIISDMSGRAIWSEDVILNAGNNDIQVLLPQMTAGNYILQLQNTVIHQTARLSVY
ncbi:GEVED domain-containing protein [Taibaiella soli]|uniref:Uncharacterized protein n=1 Tax=Taibaiella soli TaxID=1649169 RepID=A0A2W2AJ20_9BACT|nr:GEVED domain-containing protein [Taibaiella soli]PZF72240.1 hypothetical protein DN068_15025 [Taibaiella soli]